MNKALINEFGDVIFYDNETNSVKKPTEYLRDCGVFIATEDGQFISEREVVDYEKGDIILILRDYTESGVCRKLVRCNDVFAKDDLIRWIKEQKANNEVV